MLNFYGSFIKLMCNISALIFWVRVDFGYELVWVRVDLGTGWHWVRVDLGTSWIGTSWFGYELTGNPQRYIPIE